MKDELFKTKLDKETYFALWRRKNPQPLAPSDMDKMYAWYLARYEVYTRDTFKCQNTACEGKTDLLTVHHIKAQRNGGEDKPRNLITLCDKCHKDYERGRKPIVVSNNEKLPSHVRGKLFQIIKGQNRVAQWKKVKKILKRFRKVLRKEGFKITLHEYLDIKEVPEDLRQIIVSISVQD